MSTITLENTTFKFKLITTVLATVFAVLLPQLFHAVGAVSGMGSSLGVAFLPMHLPVLLAGLLGGPLAGVIVGTASPLVSFIISGMPLAGSLPFMMLELATYGLIGGMLSGKNIPILVKLLIIQATGRTVRILAVLIVICGLESQTVQLSSITDLVTVSLPGILLQWVLLPLIFYRVKGLKKYGY